MKSVVLLLLVGCGLATASRTSNEDKDTFKVNIVHVNDVHNRIEQTSSSFTPCSADSAAAGKCFGGYARISSMLKRQKRLAKQEKSTFYFVHAGDEFMGSLWDTIYQGQASALLQRTVDSVRPNVQVPGNHEYDYGPDQLANYILNATHRFTSCNTNTSGVPRLTGLLKPFVWLRHSSLKIAVVGWTTPDTAYMSSPGAVTFNPIIDSVKAVIPVLRRKKADIIIGLSHAGYVIDQVVAAAVPELDLIIGGHTHTFLANTGSAPITDLTTNAFDTPVGPYPTFVSVTPSNGAAKSIPVVQAFWGSKYIGLLKLSYSKATGLTVLQGSGPVLLGGSNSSSPVAEDPAVAAVIAPLKGAVDALQFQVLGKALVPLDGVRDNVRSRETNLGNFIVDSMVSYIQQLPGFEETFGETFIGLQNGGGIRASIDAGNVTLGGVVTVLPFGNVVSVVRVTGAALVQAIQGSLELYPGQGRFAQVAGLRYFHNNAALVSVYLLKDGQQQSVLPAALYNVVTNNFMANGGDSYTSLAAGEQIFPLGEPQDQVVADAVAADADGVAPEVEGRIINCATVSCAVAPDFVKTGCSCA